MTDQYVFDVTAPQFEAQVIARSRDVPILLDFWAEWCGPCRTLGPVLEKLANEYGGAFLLGKVDTEAERDLAYAFQVQGIPFCVLLSKGRPVDAFTGALPEAELRRFLATHGIEPRTEAGAQEAADPDSPAERWRAGLAAAARNDVETARERLGGIPEEDPAYGGAQRVIDGLAARNAPLDPSAGPAAAAIGAARDKLDRGDFDGAAEDLLASLEIDKALAEGNARRTILLCFELLALEPGAEERLAGLRRRLATLLF